MLGYKSSSDNFRKFLVFNWMHMIGKDFNVLIHYDLLIKKIRQKDYNLDKITNNNKITDRLFSPVYKVTGIPCYKITQTELMDKD